MAAIERAGLWALGLAVLATGCNDGSESSDTLAGNPQRPGATETNGTDFVCMGDDDCPEGVPCTFPNPDAGAGQCASDDDGSGAADGTCLAGSPECDDLGPADQPASGAAGGTCLAGSPECDDLGPADQPASGAADGTCLAGSPECDDLGPADQPASGAAGGTCLAGSPDCADLGPADGPGPGAPGLCETDADCPDSHCMLEPETDVGVCAR